MKTLHASSQAVKASRLLRVIAITAASLCLAGGVAYAGFALPGPAAQLPAAPPLQRATNPLTWTVFLPLIVSPRSNIQFAVIGYNCCGPNSLGQFEHIHFKNFGTTAVSITGWIISSTTGYSYTFPAASAPPFSSTNKEMTLNTNYSGNVDNIYIFNWNINRDVWPNGVGIVHYAYMYDAGHRLVMTCAYTPANNDNGNANCE